MNPNDTDEKESRFWRK